MSITRWVLGGLAVLAVNAPADALAHAGFYRGYDIVVEPGDPDHVVVQSNVWGYNETLDGGETWTWVCAETFGAASTNYEHRPMVILPGGVKLMSAEFDGLLVSRSGSACDFEPATEFLENEATGEPKKLVKGVALSRQDGSLVHAITATGGANGARVLLWSSTDQGASWTISGELPDGPAGEDFFASGLAVAPSAPDRIYVIGTHSGVTGQAVVQRTDDGGVTWNESAFGHADSTTAMTTLRIQAVHPTQPDTLLVWADRFERPGGDIQPDELWLSSDAGATWRRLLASVGDMPGGAFAPTGDALMLSGPEDGLSVAELSPTGALLGGPRQIRDEPFWGLLWNDHGLYAGTNNFVVGEGFTASVSRDRGATFEGLFDVCDDIQPLLCPGHASLSSICQEVFEQARGFRDDFIRPRCDPTESDAAPPSAEAGVSGDGRHGIVTPRTGCSCRAARREQASSGCFAAALVLALARQNRRDHARRWVARRARP